jgi:hypothetical protein
MHLDDLIPKLQLSIGPVILISGVGLLLLSMTNRLGRTIDRSRQLSDAARKSESEDYDVIAYQLRVVARRAHILRTAIALATGSVLTAAVMIVSLFVCALLKWDEAYWIAGLFITCMGLLIASLIFFLWDINLSLAALEREIQFDEAVCNRKSKRLKRETC